MIAASLVAFAAGNFVYNVLCEKIGDGFKGWENERRRAMYGGIAVVAGLAVYGVLLTTGLNLMRLALCS